MVITLRSISTPHPWPLRGVWRSTDFLHFRACWRASRSATGASGRRGGRIRLEGRISALLREDVSAGPSGEPAEHHHRL